MAKAKVGSFERDYRNGEDYASADGLDGSRLIHVSVEELSLDAEEYDPVAYLVYLGVGSAEANWIVNGDPRELPQRRVALVDRIRHYLGKVEGVCGGTSAQFEELVGVVEALTDILSCLE